MANVVREDKDQQNAALKITIHAEDYSGPFQAELRQYRKEGSFKGFRRGKAPMGFIKKMFGKSALANVVNRMLQDELISYLTKEELNFLGQPVPSADQEYIEFDPDSDKEYAFSFDIGLAPTIELTGLDESATFEKPAILVTENMIDDDLEAARTRMGETKEVEDDILEDDLLQVEAIELDGDQPKENGWETTFSVLVNKVKEEIRADLLGKTLDHKFRFNIFEIEEGFGEDEVRKHLLNIENPEEAPEIGTDFEGTITKITRRVPAELDEDFFEGYFRNMEVTNEEEARKVLKENIEEYYNNQADTLLWKVFRDHLMEQNPITLPDDFLKRWLQFTNEEITEENVHKEYPTFSENMKWTLIRRELIKHFDISVDENDINRAIEKNFKERFGGEVDPATMAMILNRFKEDEERIEDLKQDLISDKLFEQLKATFTLDEKEVSAEAFDDRIRELRESFLKETTAEANQEAEEEAGEEKEEEVADAEKEG
jgi:trigger factor